MRTKTLALAAIAIATAAPTSQAELQSGIAVGGKIGAYSTTKCGGVDDGVKVGRSLCYT